MARKYLRGLQYTTGTNGRDIPIFMKLCYEFWAYCVNGNSSFLTVLSASNANPIQITTSTPHGLVTNQLVGVYGVQGNTNANGGFLVNVQSPTTFNLSGAVGNATYTGGGTIVIPGGIPTSPVSGPSGFFEGSSVLAIGNDGVTSAIGPTLTAASSTPFTVGMAGKHVVIWLPGARTGTAPSMAGLSLPQNTINVVNTLGFPASGTVFVVTSDGTQTVSYASIPNTTISSLSNNAVLPQATVNVVSTTGFPTSGTFNVKTTTGEQIITYTGITATSFTGCTGGTGTVVTGDTVTAPFLTGCSGGTGYLDLNASVSVNQPSTDDSIYKIIEVNSSSQVRLVPFSGGTPDISTLKNNLTSRASLCYRVIDLVGASQLSVANGNYFVGNLKGAPSINSGQAVSQFQFILRGSANAYGQLGIVGSPTNSWNGSGFSGTGSNTPISERTNANGLNYSGTAINVTGFVTMCADTDFLFGHILSSNSNGSGTTKGFYFSVITPQRLYTQTQDPNVLATWVGGNGLNSTTGNDSICNYFGMVGTDGITRSSNLITRNLVGDTGNASVGTAYTTGSSLSTYVAFQSQTGQMITSEPLMSTVATGQFSLARARFRPFRLTSSSVPTNYLVGNKGEYIHLANGILMPWDGSILPYPILAGGT